MSFYRYLSTAGKPMNRHFTTPIFSEVVKQLSKFASHDELIGYLQRPIQHCHVNRMIEAGSSKSLTPISLVKTASDLHDQLLVRLAHSIGHFQTLPFLPAANPTLLSLHERYLKLFEHFLQFPRVKTNTDEEKFFRLVNMFISQNNDIIGQLSIGCREAQKYFKSYKIMKDFLDNVLRDRLSMRIIAEHYLELHKQVKNPTADNNWFGSVCMNFQPARLVQHCIKDVSSICFETYSVVPPVKIENFMERSIPYFPFVVEYVLREILKNSMRAVVEYHKVLLGGMQNVRRHFEDNQDKPLCTVSITSDPEDEHFIIAIQDQGGGINEPIEKLFRYMYTGDLKDRKEDEEETDVIADFQERMIESQKQMYGHGIGLPICRLYAEFLNGSLTFRDISRFGVDVFLRLGYIHTNSEHVQI